MKSVANAQSDFRKPEEKTTVGRPFGDQISLILRWYMSQLYEGDLYKGINEGFIRLYLKIVILSCDQKMAVEYLRKLPNDFGILQSTFGAGKTTLVGKIIALIVL